MEDNHIKDDKHIYAELSEHHNKPSLPKVCFSYICIMAIYHTPIYSGECGLSFIVHTQTKVTLTYLNTHRHDA